MPRLVELPSELLLAIAYFCSTADKKQLCETCLLLNEVCMPALYRAVDLSSHNADIKARLNVSVLYPLGQKLVPMHFTERVQTDLDKDIFAAQIKFIATINRMPHYGSHVWELHWTVLDATGHKWASNICVHGSKPNEKGECGHEECPVYAPEDEPLWETFKTLVNVSTLDLAWQRPWREVTLPPRIFSNATSIKLSGSMTFDFVKRILGDPTLDDFRENRLNHLCLDNLLQWPTIKNLPDFKHLRDLRSYFQSRCEEQTLVVQWKDSRSMVGVLHPYIGYYSALTSLHLTTVGKFRAMREDPRDDYMYSSWAEFVHSVRNTLRTFYFEQGVCPNRWSVDQFKTDNLGPYRPMDRLFVKWMYPTLIKAAWPRLTRMEIRGVGRRAEAHWVTDPKSFVDRWRSDPDVEWYHLGVHNGQLDVDLLRAAFTVAMKEQLAEHLGAGVEHRIQEKVDRDYDAGVREGSLGPVGIPSVDLFQLLRRRTPRP